MVSTTSSKIDHKLLKSSSNLTTQGQLAYFVPAKAQLNMEVTVRGCTGTKPITLVALYANCNPCTQISLRLAERLGLVEGGTHDVYCLDLNVGDGVPIKRKKSRSMMSVTTNLQLNGKPLHLTCSPVIVTDCDFFYEMIIGHDLVDSEGKHPMGACLTLWQQSMGLTATPGPGFDEGSNYIGHNVEVADYKLLAPLGYDEFYELNCSNSAAVSRLAINPKTRVLVVRYEGSDRICRYELLPAPLEEQLVTGGSSTMGDTLGQVRQVCDVSELERFPATVLVREMSVLV